MLSLIILSSPTLSPKDFSNMLEGAYSENDIFATPRSAIENAGASFYSLLLTIGAVVFVTALILAGIKLGSSASIKRNEGKERLKAICFASAAAFGILGIASLVYYIASQISNS